MLAAATVGNLSPDMKILGCFFGFGAFFSFFSFTTLGLSTLGFSTLAFFAFGAAAPEVLSALALLVPAR